MCGIVGAVSTKNIVPILIEGLKRLEYRGYDSCGVAVHQDGELRRARSTPRVAELEAGAPPHHRPSRPRLPPPRPAPPRPPPRPQPPPPLPPRPGPRDPPPPPPPP